MARAATKKSDIVHFLMPDGSKVSNDPRFSPDEEEAFEVDPGLGAKPYSQWSGDELKAEIARRNSGREEDRKLKLQKGMKKSDVVALLTQDDGLGGSGPAGPGPNGGAPIDPTLLPSEDDGDDGSEDNE